MAMRIGTCQGLRAGECGVREIVVIFGRRNVADPTLIFERVFLRGRLGIWPVRSARRSTTHPGWSTVIKAGSRGLDYVRGGAIGVRFTWTVDYPGCWVGN